MNFSEIMFTVIGLGSIVHFVHCTMYVCSYFSFMLIDVIRVCILLPISIVSALGLYAAGRVLLLRETFHCEIHRGCYRRRSFRKSLARVEAHGI